MFSSLYLFNFEARPLVAILTLNRNDQTSLRYPKSRRQDYPRRLLGNRIQLRHSQRFQRWLIDRGCFRKPVGALVIRYCRTRFRPEQTIHFPLIITLLLQCGLDVCDHLIGRPIVIAVDRAVICVVRVGSVAPSRNPVSRIPGIPSAIYENYAVVVMASPPTLVVPL